MAWKKWHLKVQNIQNVTQVYTKTEMKWRKETWRWRPCAAVVFMLTLHSRCSRLWSEAHFLWSSESSSTWLSRLKWSRASFSCISRTCSSCSKEHTFPTDQMSSTRQLLTSLISFGCRRITAKSKVFPWHQTCKNSTKAIRFQSDSCNKATFHLALFSACNWIFPWWPLQSRLSYQKPVVCPSGSRSGGWGGLPPSLSRPRRL